MQRRPQLVLLMGVAGSGKSTTGTRLAERLGWRFVDADDLHPLVNVRKMAAGTPLDDADREPWVRQVRSVTDDMLCNGESVVLACSALSPTVQQRLGCERGEVHPVLLQPAREELQRRLRQRRQHFFPPELLDSQLKALHPGVEELAFSEESPEQIIEGICQQLDLTT